MHPDELSVFVGRPVDEVVRELQGRFPNYTVDELEQSTITTMEFRDQRIRVWFDAASSKVVRVSAG